MQSRRFSKSGRRVRTTSSEDSSGRRSSRHLRCTGEIAGASQASGCGVARRQLGHRAAVRDKFDLLISDIALPDGTGMDLMMQLRAIANVPGLAISGFGNNRDIERSLQARFSEHLIKPIKLDNLEAAIERALGTT
jgi:CheY-like chemotaxis protein